MRNNFLACLVLAIICFSAISLFNEINLYIASFLILFSLFLFPFFALAFVYYLFMFTFADDKDEKIHEAYIPPHRR